MGSEADDPIMLSALQHWSRRKLGHPKSDKGSSENSVPPRPVRGAATVMCNGDDANRIALQSVNQ